MEAEDWNKIQNENLKTKTRDMVSTYTQVLDGK